MGTRCVYMDTASALAAISISYLTTAALSTVYCPQVRRFKSSVQDLQNALRLVSRMDAPVRSSKGALASSPIEPTANPYAHILANNDRGVLHGIEVLR